MIICVIGSGGREHAICKMISLSPKVSKLYFNKPIKFDNNFSLEQISLELNKILEKMILKNPDQWIWSHDRWK